MKRKQISKRTRFSIFARDNFTCRYCGRNSEQVRLHIDHINPVCQGGTNEPENLITSCEDCNLGKASKTIQAATPGDSHSLALHQEYKEQTALLAEAEKAVLARQQLREWILNYYCELTGEKSLNRQSLSVYAAYANEHGPETLFDWFETAHRNIGFPSPLDFCKYVSAIRRNQKEQQYA